MKEELIKAAERAFELKLGWWHSDVTPGPIFNGGGIFLFVLDFCLSEDEQNSEENDGYEESCWLLLFCSEYAG